MARASELNWKYQNRDATWMQLYARLRFLHWEALTSSLLPHPQRNSWSQRGLGRARICCCSAAHTMPASGGSSDSSFTELHISHHTYGCQRNCAWLSPFCSLKLTGKTKDVEHLQLSVSWPSVSGHWNSADCSSPMMSKDSWGHSSGSSLQMPTAPSCETSQPRTLL